MSVKQIIYISLDTRHCILKSNTNITRINHTFDIYFDWNDIIDIFINSKFIVCISSLELKLSIIIHFID